MITTFFGQDGLGSNAALLLSLLLGFGFGFALEQAGFGSSRRLAGIFYFRDMTVLRVMFTAMVTAMLGLQVALALGAVSAEQIYFLPTIYGAQIVGGPGGDFKAIRQGLALDGQNADTQLPQQAGSYCPCGAKPANDDIERLRIHGSQYASEQQRLPLMAEGVE